MAFEINTSIEIKSSAEGIWQKLTAFSKYSEWNPFIKSIEGEVVEGKQIEVSAGGMSFKPQVLAFNTNKKLEWKGILLSSFLFEGTHLFEIVEHSQNKCTFNHSEKFKGILVPLLKRKLQNETKPGFESMNQALKKEVES